MPMPLKILLVEDSPEDAELILCQLRQVGFAPDWTRVDCATDFAAGLERAPDIILSDYSLPQFDGLKAVEMLRQSGRDIPFILISGTVGEGVAVEAMKLGATDYLLKDRIARLGPAVQRALDEQRLRSERQQAELEQRRNEERLRQMDEMQAAILNALPSCIALLNPSGVIVSVNDSWRRFAVNNRLPDTNFCVGQNYLDICEQAVGEHAAEARAAAAGVRRVLCGDTREFTLEYPCHCPREKRWFQLTVTPLHKHQKRGAVVSHANITERKLAELALARSQAEMVAAQRLSHFGSWEVNLTTLATLWSDETYRILEQNPVTFQPTHTSIRERTHPEDRAAVEAMFRSSVTRTDTHVIEHRLQFPDGRIKFVEERWQCSQDEQGKPVRAIGTCQDITERKRTEQARRESEEKFRQLAENINDVFRLLDPVTEELLYVSPAYEKIWGRSCASLYAAPLDWLAAVHPDDRRRVVAAVRSVRVTGHYEEMYRILRPDGSQRWILDRAFLVRTRVGEPHRIVGTAKDITDQRKLEEQLLQAQKMEAIGQLAGGVAHDFNNILAVIQMQAGMMRLEQNLTAEQRESANEIEKAAHRGANLTRQLLLFSRRQTMQPAAADLNEIVRSISKMLQRILGESVQMQFQLAPENLFVHADSGMMDQMIMNLAVNGRDAMPRGGRLILATEAVEFDAAATTQSAQIRPGKFVRLSVTDSGAGIPPEVLPRIFEPFFTTKQRGKGTGLGLATVFGIVQQHNGWINVYSEIGRGTTFQIYLPHLPGVTGQATAAAAAKTPSGGTETILLVEDEPALRQSAQIALARLGYCVLEAADGAEALDIWRQHRNEIRLLLTDLVMPGGMNGKELAKQLQHEKPGLKVVYVSGYSADIADTGFPLTEGGNFLTKPFPTTKLAKIVREKLDETG
jgi:PAS domain S-box-containing protein